MCNRNTDHNNLSDCYVVLSFEGEEDIFLLEHKYIFINQYMFYEQVEKV